MTEMQELQAIIDRNLLLGMSLAGVLNKQNPDEPMIAVFAAKNNPSRFRFHTTKSMGFINAESYADVARRLRRLLRNNELDLVVALDVEENNPLSDFQRKHAGSAEIHQEEETI